MSSISSIALSGLAVAQQRLRSSAHNLANAGTEGFHREIVQAQTQAGGGVEAVVGRSDEADAGLSVEDVVEQLEAKQAFTANLRSLKTEDDMLGALLDIRA